MIKRSINRYNNGLEHVHGHAPFLKNISVSFFVKCGSANEFDEKEYGISHFLEHMVFNGSKGYPDYKKVEKDIAGKGIMQNAWTWSNMTNYYMITSKESLEYAFNVLSQRVFFPLLREEDVEKEKGIVLEEIKMRENDAENVLYTKLKAEFLKDTSYAHHTLGDTKSITELNKSLLEDYHARYYRPSNVRIVTYGGISYDDIKPYVDNVIEILESADNVIPYEDQNHPQQSSERIDIKKDVASSSYIKLMMFDKFHSINEFLMFTLLESVLANGEGSRWNQELQIKNSLVAGFDFSLMVFRDKLELLFSSSSDKSNLDQIKEKVDQDLSNLSHWLSREDFFRAQNYVYASFVRASESLNSMNSSSWLNIERINFLYGTNFDTAEILKAVKEIDFDEFLGFFVSKLGKTHSIEGTVTPK